MEVAALEVTSGEKIKTPDFPEHGGLKLPPLHHIPKGRRIVVPQGDDAVLEEQELEHEIDEREHDKHVAELIEMREDTEEAARKDMAEKIRTAKRHKIEKRKSLMLLSHEQVKERVLEYYGDAELQAMDPITIHTMFVDIFDDLVVLDRIMIDDKRGRWADAWELGIGIVFGILIMIGSIFIAMDASKENPIVCTTTMAADKSCETECDRAKNMVGPTGMLPAGTWIVVAGSLGFVLVVLWRILVKVIVARRHNLSLLNFFNDLVKDGSSSKVKQINETGVGTLARGQGKRHKSLNWGQKPPVQIPAASAPDADNSSSSSSRYGRRAPSFYAPRSAYHRVARGYGSPIMC